MEFFEYMTKLVWRLMQTPLTMYGHTFSFQNVFYLSLITALVSVLIRLLLKGQ